MNELNEMILASVFCICTTLMILMTLYKDYKLKRLMIEKGVKK